MEYIVKLIRVRCNPDGRIATEREVAGSTSINLIVTI